METTDVMHKSYLVFRSFSAALYFQYIYFSDEGQTSLCFRIHIMYIILLPVYGNEQISALDPMAATTRISGLVEWMDVQCTATVLCHTVHI